MLKTLVGRTLLVFWEDSLGPKVLPTYTGTTFLARPTAKEPKKVLGWEALGRDLERGKPLFRRKRGKVRNLDDLSLIHI